MIFSMATPQALFFLFCRIGACLMVAPGFSSERVPVRVRLLVAFTVSIALFPAAGAPIRDTIESVTPAALILLAAKELLIGIAFGLLARFFFLALETLTTTVNMTIGLGNIFSSAVEAEPTPALSTFVLTAAITLIFVMDLHIELIHGLMSSYRLVPFSRTLTSDDFLPELSDTLSQAYVLALRITSPFLLFSLIINLGFGFLARLIPQAPIYFISAPFLIVAGLYSVYLISNDFITAFLNQFGSWVRHG